MHFLDGERPAAARMAWVTGFVAFAFWLLSRALMALLWSDAETFIDHDVRYYFWQLANDGVAGALIEYPTPIAVFLDAIRLVAGPSENAYVAAFVLVMAVLDGIATVWLWHSQGHAAACYWAGYTFAIGSLIWFRIDLLPAVAVLAASIWIVRRPVASGAAIAVGAATKLWPAMLIAPMLGTDRWGKRRSWGFLTTGAALGLASLAFFGWTRSASPLGWQSDRGLQIESIMATVPMIRHAFAPVDRYYTELSQYNAWEIYGPGVDQWLIAADCLLAASVVLALVLGWLIAFGGAGLPGHRLAQANDAACISQRGHAILLAQVALICLTIMANKTFSPQYMIWLGGPLAVLLSRPLPRKDKVAARLLAGLGLVCAALTHLVFPLNYSGLISEHAHPGETRLLVARNLVMVALCLTSVTLALKSAWRCGRVHPEPDSAR